MLIAIDAHVHLHDTDRAGEALAAARRAFDETVGADATGVLMLCERDGFDAFAALRAKMVETGEPEARWAEADRRLLILAGRQIVSAEGLEILALATERTVPDGLPADAVIERLVASEAIIVLPWGVGKWLGRRAALVSALRERWGSRLLVGDIGGRPSSWALGAPANGATVLAGSDPLPIAGSTRHIGRYGSLLDGTLDPERPAASLRALLAAQTPRPFGRNSGIVRFLADQTRVRLPG